MLRVIISTLREVSNISLLIGIFLFIYMLIGMELFAYKVPINPEYLDKHKNTFDNILDAFLSVFIVLANNGWMKIYLDHYNATNSVVVSLFFLSLLIIGQLILLNLFISILIENFEQLSIRNDLVSKLSNLKKGSFVEQFKNKMMKIKHNVISCVTRKNKVEEGAELSKLKKMQTKSKIDDMIDEDMIEK